MRKKLIEKLSPDASEASKKLYNELNGSDGLTDITEDSSMNGEGSNGKRYFDFGFKDTPQPVFKDYGNNYFFVKDTNGTGTFEL